MEACNNGCNLYDNKQHRKQCTKLKKCTSSPVAASANDLTKTTVSRTLGLPSRTQFQKAKLKQCVSSPKYDAWP